MSLRSLRCDGRRPICCKLTMYYVQCWPIHRVLPKQRPKEPADARTCQSCQPSLWRLTIVMLEKFVFTPTEVLVIYVILVRPKQKPLVICERDTTLICDLIKHITI